MIKTKPKTFSDLEIGDYYYFIEGYTVHRCKFFNDCTDRHRIEAKIFFLTQEEAEFELEKRKCESVMLKYGRETFNYNSENFVIQFYYPDRKIYLIPYKFTLFQGCIYFDSEELAQKAINEIGIERLKKYVFRVFK